MFDIQYYFVLCSTYSIFAVLYILLYLCSKATRERLLVRTLCTQSFVNVFQITHIEVPGTRIMTDHVLFRFEVSNIRLRSSFSTWSVLKRYAQIVELDQVLCVMAFMVCEKRLFVRGSLFLVAYVASLEATALEYCACLARSEVRNFDFSWFPGLIRGPSAPRSCQLPLIQWLNARRYNVLLPTLCNSIKSR